MEVTGNPQKILKENKQIFTTWFETWLISHVPKLLQQPKWFRTERDIKICDIVLFLKQEGSIISNNYQYGMIREIIQSKDGIIQKVVVKYRNHNENTDRFTTRAVRELVMIHPIDELNLIEELGQISIKTKSNS